MRKHPMSRQPQHVDDNNPDAALCLLSDHIRAYDYRLGLCYDGS